MPFYSEKVMEHFQNPKNVGEIPDADGVGEVGNPVCVVPDTLIQANSQIIPIKKINKDIRVLSHDGHYHNVRKMICRPYKGDIYYIKVNNLGSVCVTPEHNILALKPDKRRRFVTYKKFAPDWYSAEELIKGDIVLYPILRETEELKSVNLNVKKLKWDFKSKTLPTQIKISNDFLRLGGYYLSEGYVRLDPCKGTLGFCFNSKEKEYIEDVINTINNIFNIQPAKLITNPKGTAINIVFYSAHLARFFAENFGNGAQGKHIPHWAMLLPKDKQKYLLKGIWRGDGYVSEKSQLAKYVTISKELAFQIRTLLQRQKIISSFLTGKAYGIHKEYYSLYVKDDASLEKIAKIMNMDLKIKSRTRERQKTWFDDNYYYSTIRKIEKINYSGKIYNLEVEEPHSYVSEALTLHNCGDMMTFYIKVKDNILEDVKFKTFGCGAAIAVSSMVSEMAKGKTIEDAMKITNADVAKELDGLPPNKMHCSNLGADALHNAIKNYLDRKKTSEKTITQCDNTTCCLGNVKACAKKEGHDGK